MKKHIAIVLCFIFMFVTIFPAISAAKMSRAQVAQYWKKLCVKAKTDAEKETSGILWMGAGCVLNWIGVVGAYLLDAAPPAERLIGKPASYTKQYTKCYQQRAKDIQTGNAWAGLGIGTGLAVIGMVIYFAVVASAVNTAVDAAY